MNRRQLLRHGALSSLLLLTVIVQQGAIIHISRARGQSTRRPFRMLVLGDSVMWGQGLADEHKFSYRVREWICEQRSNGSCPDKDDVQIHVEAHSGAVIAKPSQKHQQEEERFTRDVAPVRYPGEVNHDYRKPLFQLRTNIHCRIAQWSWTSQALVWSSFLFPTLQRFRSFTFSTARNASCGLSTRPTFFMRSQES